MQEQFFKAIDDNSADTVRRYLTTSVVSSDGSSKVIDVNRTQDETGLTALHRAAKSNAADVALVLLEAGADVMGRAGKNGDTPLHTAARMNAVDVAKLLIDWGADVNGRNKNGDTPLHAAVKGEDK